MYNFQLYRETRRQPQALPGAIRTASILNFKKKDNIHFFATLPLILTKKFSLFSIWKLLVDIITGLFLFLIKFRDSNTPYCMCLHGITI